jgi:protein tyrosine phosphatase (PTP) superfamily phosphohydrolase (DUF442 family)
MKRLTSLAAIGACVLWVGGCADKPTSASVPSPAPAATTAVAATQPSTLPAIVFRPVPNQDLLHNAHFVTDKVISGAQPEGDTSFAYLKELGVRTIISVDGAQPDVEGAKKYGLEYVHLPITYSGVTVDEGKAIAKAIAEKPGPIYLHCHHGKHRSAAAVAVACVYDGMLKPEQAESVLKTFGTGANYKGLWRDALSARPIDAKEIRNLKIDFVERARIDDLASMMVDTDERLENLKAAPKAGGRAPAGQPKLDPAHEALMLHELLREMMRTGPAQAKPADFGKLAGASEAAALSLHETLSAKPLDPAKADAAMKRAMASCLDCHKAYRD